MNQAMDDPYLIGIAGPSGSGKTTIARALVARLAAKQAQLLPLDGYYRDLSHQSPETRAQVNFDAPEALDADLLIEQVKRLATGQPADTPLYDFATHCRIASRRRIEPGGVLVLEGLFVLYWPVLRGVLNLSVYVEAPDETCVRRRLARDIQERSRSRQSVLRQYEQSVRPMARAYVLPTKRHADLIVDGTTPVEDSVSRIVAAYRTSSS
jgi:uridine kinase